MPFQDGLEHSTLPGEVYISAVEVLPQNASFLFWFLQNLFVVVIYIVFQTSTKSFKVYLYLYNTNSVCVCVCLSSIGGQTAGPITTKFGTHMRIDLGMVPT